MGMKNESLVNLATKLVINVAALLVVAYVVPGFHFDTLAAAVISAVIIGIVNTYIRPILQIIALPISIVTVGIAAFFINVALLWGVSLVVPGFNIDSFVTAAAASILLSLTSWFLHKLAR